MDQSPYEDVKVVEVETQDSEASSWHGLFPSSANLSVIKNNVSAASVAAFARYCMLV